MSQRLMGVGSFFTSLGLMGVVVISFTEIDLDWYPVPSLLLKISVISVYSLQRLMQIRDLAF